MKTLTSWLSIPDGSDFSIYNLPFGIFSTEKDTRKRVGVAIGDAVVDLACLVEHGLIDLTLSVVYSDFLNDFISLGKERTNGIRLTLQDLLVQENSPLKGYPQAFVKQDLTTMHLPIQVGDYTDFYASLDHATNVGKMFRDPANALLPNWKHMPVGYHGRASSIISGGQSFHRPKGQVLLPSSTAPVYRPTNLLDFELEMAFIIGKSTPLGTQVPIGDAAEYIFGMVMMNDWSARDIQKWEYVPLGPFLGKSFATAISPWVVTMEALTPFLVDNVVQDEPVLPYLKTPHRATYDMPLSVSIRTEGGIETTVCRSNYRYMYWNMHQQLAHHTVNGCNIRVGDLLASGTISGPDEASFGSMLELAWRGTKPITLQDGTSRSFINDYDTVVIKGSAIKEHVQVGFGVLENTVLPALD